MNAAAANAAETGAPTKPKSPVRVAVVQFNPQVGLDNLGSNALAARQRLQQAVKEGANLIVLPELDVVQARTAPIWNQLNDLQRDRRIDLYDQLLGFKGAQALPR